MVFRGSCGAHQPCLNVTRVLHRHTVAIVSLHVDARSMKTPVFGAWASRKGIVGQGRYQKLGACRLSLQDAGT